MEDKDVKYNNLRPGDMVVMPDGKIGTMMCQINSQVVVAEWRDDPFMPTLTAVHACPVSQCKILTDISARLNGATEIKLYSPICGDVILKSIADDGFINLESVNGDIAISLDKYGRYNPNGESLLYPSRDSKNWDEFERPNIRKPGENYWFVSSKMNICERVDLGATQDNLHYESGNYFSCEAKAQLAKDRIIETFKNIGY